MEIPGRVEELFSGHAVNTSLYAWSSAVLADDSPENSSSNLLSVAGMVYFYHSVMAKTLAGEPSMPSSGRGMPYRVNSLPLSLLILVSNWMMMVLLPSRVL